MQSRLPDVNTAFITHRKGAKEAIKARNWDNAFGSLYSWNALLPRYTEKVDEIEKLKYRVVISDIEYNKITAIRSVAICNKCKKETDYKSIQILELIIPLVDSIIMNQQIEKIWICPKCNQENQLAITIISEASVKEPVYWGVVPKPPRRKEGLSDRGNYDRKCTQWCWNMINELEEKSTQFREDYRENKAEFEAWEENVPYDAKAELEDSEES